MFSTLFRTPIELTLNDRVLRFDSEADFAFAIEGRTDLGGDEAARLMAMSDDALTAEIAQLEGEEIALRRHFEDAMTSRERLDEKLAEVDPRRWRREHQWDGLLCALALVSTPAHGIKRSAVVTYLSYLATRRNVAAAISRHRLERATPRGIDDDERTAASHAGEGDCNDVALPRGQATLVMDSDCENVTLRFSQHHHRLLRLQARGLRRETQIELLDDGGKRWVVPHGMSCVGRDRSCDIALRPVLKDISRAHAMMNLDEHGRVWVTDTSSQGTYIVREDDVT